MREIREILKQIEELAPGEKAVLATVVDLKGSGYRLPGARMLITSNGDAFGTVSGGCLEADVMERAKRVLASGWAEVFSYDTTVEEDSVFNLNMGCRGVMRILLEPIGHDRTTPFFHTLAHTFEEDRRATTMATVIGVRGEDRLKIGDRMIRSGYAAVDVLPSIVADLETFAGADSPHEIIRYETERGFVELAFENLKPPVRLAILGAGADAVPLAAAAWDLGWQVVVYDHRPAFLSSERFPNAAALKLAGRELPMEIAADEMTAIVLMNHNYDRDKDLIPTALRSNAFYVGALGPKRRTQQILDEHKEAGETFEIEQLSRLRSPAGLDIGGDSPETIAVSIIAEIQSVLKKRPGGPLRDRSAPIYDRR